MGRYQDIFYHQPNYILSTIQEEEEEEDDRESEEEEEEEETDDKSVSPGVPSFSPVLNFISDLKSRIPPTHFITFKAKRAKKREKSFMFCFQLAFGG